MKPRVFVGSSVESLKIAEAILYNLEFVAQVTTWSQGIFKLSKSALNSLTTELKNFDFGIFVLSPDDVLQIRDEKFSVARDNVIFELGLFIGKLGAERCFIVVPRDCEELHLPTDLTGFAPATYEANRDDNNWKAALNYACIDIKESIEKLGRFENSQPLTEEFQKITKAKESKTFVENVNVIGILDQSLTEPNGFVAMINEGFAFVAQTYTAGVTGMLSGLNINVIGNSSMRPNCEGKIYSLRVAVCKVEDMFPSTVINEVILQSDESLLSDFIKFPPIIKQIAGVQYAIVVSYLDAPPAGAGQACGAWYGTNGNKFPKGEYFHSIDGESWFLAGLNNFDLHFQTYVIPNLGRD